MAFDAKQWWTEVATKAGLPKEKVEAVLDTLSDEKVSNVLGEQVMMRSDYSRNMDALSNEKKEMERKNREYYEGELKRTKANEEAVARANSILQEYVNTYGELPSAAAVRSGNPDAKLAFDASKFLSKEEHETALKRIESQSLYVIKEGIKASQDYYSRFGKPLDIDALEKHAIEKQLPINLAYQDFIKNDLEVAQSKSFEEKLKAAKEEGAREALSHVKQPLDNAPRGISPFRENLESTLKATKDAPRPTERELREGFVSAFHEAANAGK